MKNIILTITLLLLVLTNAQRLLHAHDLWRARKVNHALVSITCEQDTNPAVIESATDQAVIVSCDKLEETSAQ